MKYLVTGGSGFLGIKLIERLVGQGHEVITVARNEGKLIELQQKFPVQIITGDISDPFICRQALLADNIEGIYHLAAFKHVNLAENQARECIKSNIIGTLNLLEQSLYSSAKFIIGISTDKAAQITGVYGATKFLMEAMFRHFEQMTDRIKYRVVRYGNVLYSTGSVLCKWKELMQHGKQIVVTDHDATRFFWTIDQAVDLIFECLENAKSAAPYIPEMKSIRIGDLLHVMRKKYSVDHGVLSTKTIGLQPGENLHETMDGKIFSNQVPQYSIDEIMEMI